MTMLKREIEQLEYAIRQGAHAIAGAEEVVVEATKRTDIAFSKLDKSTAIVQKKVDTVRGVL